MKKIALITLLIIPTLIIIYLIYVPLPVKAVFNESTSQSQVILEMYGANGFSHTSYEAGEFSHITHGDHGDFNAWKLFDFNTGTLCYGNNNGDMFCKFLEK